MSPLCTQLFPSLPCFVLSVIFFPNQHWMRQRARLYVYAWCISGLNLRSVRITDFFSSLSLFLFLLEIIISWLLWFMLRRVANLRVSTTDWTKPVAICFSFQCCSFRVNHSSRSPVFRAYNWTLSSISSFHDYLSKLSNDGNFFIYILIVSLFHLCKVKPLWRENEIVDKSYCNVELNAIDGLS